MCLNVRYVVVLNGKDAIHEALVRCSSALSDRPDFYTNVASFNVHAKGKDYLLEFCTGAGAVKSRGKTAGVPREREERPPFIPRECRERDCLLRESRGTGSKRCSPPAGAGVPRESPPVP